MKNKILPTCICELCRYGIPEDKTCYVGVLNCLKNGVYTRFENKEALVVNKELEHYNKALDELLENLSDNDTITKERWKEILLNETN